MHTYVHTQTLYRPAGSLKYAIQDNSSGVWRESSDVSTGCSSRGPRFNFKHPQKGQELANSSPKGLASVGTRNTCSFYFLPFFFSIFFFKTGFHCAALAVLPFLLSSGIRGCTTTVVYRVVSSPQDPLLRTLI